MNTEEKFAAIKRKTRQRFLFAGIVMALYFCFILNYTEGGAAVIALLGTAAIPGALVMFISLIVIFIGLELVFLFLNRKQETE